MALASSRMTAQGQVSVPAAVRRKLGIGPGSVIEWEEEGEYVLVRRAGKYTSRDVHEAIFAGKQPAPRTLDELNAGVRQAVRKRHARR